MFNILLKKKMNGKEIFHFRSNSPKLIFRLIGKYNNQLTECIYYVYKILDIYMYIRMNFTLLK